MKLGKEINGLVLKTVSDSIWGVLTKTVTNTVHYITLNLVDDTIETPIAKSLAESLYLNIYEEL